MLKPCKVKRFLATEDLSVVGLVTGSSGNKWFEKERVVVTAKKRRERKRKVEVMKSRRSGRVYPAALQLNSDVCA